MLAMCIIALGVFAEVIVPYIDNAAETLVNPKIYIDAVLTGNE